MTSSGSVALDRLIARVKALEERVDKANRTPQLGNSSMEGGAVTVYQPGTGGLPGAIVGQQPDGTFGAVVVGGPVPPVPTAPGLETVTSGVRIAWDGDFVQTGDDRSAGRPTVAPQDFKAVELQLSDSPDFPIGPATRGGLFVTSAAGGYAFAPWAAGTDLYARARSWTFAGKFSPWSVTTGPVPAGKVAVGDLGFDISTLAGTHVFYGTADPNSQAGVTVSYGDLWLEQVAAGPPPQYQSLRWTPADGPAPDRWVLLADQAATGALEAAATAQQAAAAKATLFTQGTAPPWSGPAGTAYWVDTAHGNRPMAWNGAQWVAYQLGNGAITPNSLVASDVVATGTVSASLLEAIMVLVTAIVGGDPAAQHARFDSTGLRAFRGDVNGDGVPDESVRLGTSGADRIGVVGAGGELLFAADETGYVTASGLSVVGGIRVGRPDYTGRGGTLYEILDRRPRGMVGRGADWGTYDFNTVAGTGIFDVTARIYFNRMYKICVRCRVNGSTVDDAIAEIGVRYEWSSDGTPAAPPVTPCPAPTINSAFAGRIQAGISRPEAQGVYFEKPFALGSGVADSYRDMRFLLTAARPVGSTTLSVYGPSPDGIEMWVEDVGPYIDTAQTTNNGGGSAAQPGPPPAPQQTRYSRTWVCNWHQNWRGNDSAVNLAGAYQGLDPSGNNGVQKSYLGFSGAATDGSGLTMDAALAGARIEEVGIYLYFNHWYSYAGGQAVIGFHGFRDPAGVYGDGDKWMIGVPGWRRNEGRWISAGQPLGSAALQKFASGTWKGLMLGSPAANSYDYYGIADAEGSAQLNITYWR